MNKPAEQGVERAVDSIQQHLTDYACRLDYAQLTPEAIHAAKVRIIDTLGALIGGYFGEPCVIARGLAAQTPYPGGATVLGTRTKTTLEMAAFANGTAARYVEMNDTYHEPGSYHGHPSDMIAPILGAAEYVQASGRDYLTSVILGYEVFLRICDVYHQRGFDATNFACLGTAVAAGRLLGLSPGQLSHCISMAVVPNNILEQVRTGFLSHWKVVASGHAARAGMFAAVMARAGMEGPHLPFEGKAGWLAHIAREQFALSAMGGNGNRFKIQDTLIKPRASCGTTISSILAAEKIAPVRGDVKKVIVEVYNYAKVLVGTGEHRWNPDSRETADHSIPFVIAATLMDGTVTPRSFDEAHIWNPALRALMQKVEVVENDEFTQANERTPVEHRTRVTVTTGSGEKLVGESGGDKGDLANDQSDAQIEAKFRTMAEEVLGAKRVNAILDRLWHLDEIANVAQLPPALAFV